MQRTPAFYHFSDDALRFIFERHFGHVTDNTVPHSPSPLHYYYETQYFTQLPIFQALYNTGRLLYQLLILSDIGHYWITFLIFE